MKKWEYSCSYLHESYDQSQLEKQLNWLGDDGWELIAFRNEDRDTYGVFKRELVEAPETTAQRHREREFTAEELGSTTEKA